MESSYTPGDAAALFGGLSDWWVAGGWAIDLWVGRQTRDHADLDIATLRTNQQVLWRRLERWDLHLAAGPGVLEPWESSAGVPPPLHAVWCRETPSSAWAFEVLLNDSDGADWLFRRDPSVRMPLTRLGGVSSDGIPYLAPEIVLLFKAKNARELDEHDFEVARPVLTGDRRSWLREALAAVHPDHPWTGRLG